MTQITHDVARYAAGTATHQQDAECQCRVKMPHMHQGISHARHDDELGAGTDEYIQRALSQNLEVVGGQGQAHGEHDDTENHGLGSSAHPVEGMWEEECKYCYTYYKDRCVIGQPTAEPLKKSKHNSILLKNPDISLYFFYSQYFSLFLSVPLLFIVIYCLSFFPLFQYRVQKYIFSIE